MTQTYGFKPDQRNLEFESKYPKLIKTVFDFDYGPITQVLIVSTTHHRGDDSNTTNHVILVPDDMGLDDVQFNKAKMRTEIDFSSPYKDIESHRRLYAAKSVVKQLLHYCRFVPCTDTDGELKVTATVCTDLEPYLIDHFYTDRPIYLLCAKISYMGREFSIPNYDTLQVDPLVPITPPSS